MYDSLYRAGEGSKLNYVVVEGPAAISDVLVVGY
jgi:hypothetical protein